MSFVVVLGPATTLTVIRLAAAAFLRAPAPSLMRRESVEPRAVLRTLATVLPRTVILIVTRVPLVREETLTPTPRASALEPSERGAETEAPNRANPAGGIAPPHEGSVPFAIARGAVLPSSGAIINRAGGFSAASKTT